MPERLHLAVDDGIADLMTELAGGERKRGQWLSQLVSAMVEHERLGAGSDVESIRYAVEGASTIASRRRYSQL